MALSLDGTTGISASGNISGNNIIVTGSLTAGSFSPTSFSASGNVTGGNILTAGLISATSTITSAANITGGNLLTAGLISATSTITSAANVTGGNIRTAGLISATGGITGSQFNGSGAGLTSIPNGALSNSAVTVNGTSISLGGSGTVTANAATLTGTVLNATVVSSSLTSVGTLGSLAVTGNITSGNVSGTRGAFTNVAGTLETAAQTNITSVGTLSALSVTGNVQGGNIRTAGLVSATGAITGAALTGTSLTVSTGNVSCGNIVNTNANGVGNIGSSATRFNQVFALASSAQYADLAEKYTADADYTPGTVLEFGGDQEVTATTTSHSPRVAGIVSTQPSYIMNDGLVSDHTAMVSLTGRVPCLVLGPIAKGDRLVASAVVGHAQRLDPAQYEPGCIIGKALEDYPSPAIGTIEVAVGRF